MLDPTKRGAWFGDPEFKAEIVAKMHEHRAKDRFFQGQYRGFVDECDEGFVETLDAFRGCAIGCLLTSKIGVTAPNRFKAEWRGWHREVEKEFNIPQVIAQRIDVLFENTNSFDEAAEFAVASVEAIPVGANLNEMVAQLLHYNWHTSDEDVTQEAIQRCTDCRDSMALNRDRELFLKELSNAPLMPAARAVILAG